MPSKPPNRLPSIDSPSTSAKFLQSSTSSSSSTKIDKRQTLFGGKPSLTADDDEDDDDDDSVVMTGTEHNSASGGSSGEVIVNDSMDDGNVEVSLWCMGVFKIYTAPNSITISLVQISYRLFSISHHFVGREAKVSRFRYRR